MLVPCLRRCVCPRNESRTGRKSSHAPMAQDHQLIPDERMTGLGIPSQFFDRNVQNWCEFGRRWAGLGRGLLILAPQSELSATVFLSRTRSESSSGVSGPSAIQAAYSVAALPRARLRKTDPTPDP